ncbi:head-tail joining protein [Methylococcus mesophilus]|uniref:head-tail joining protein n=1 Tax=Methylococcus mesophilus TaxID=2993564 RepID=UPI00224A4BFE|nr:hypothetical protein [Methylococcus mesophilus]UZR28087.1 hypothetical protein OOT43_15415 [Methylococcus mesophilus]UZR30787.1 hypothetical protein OOT43_09210 [Methylococcus mesophilus]
MDLDAVNAVCLSTFGETVILWPDRTDPPPVHLTGIVSVPAGLERPGPMGAPRPEADPRLTVRSADLPAVRMGDPLKLRGLPYGIASRLDRLDGLTTLILRPR